MEPTYLKTHGEYFTNRIREALGSHHQISVTHWQDVAYDEKADMLVCKFVINGQQRQFEYFGKDIPNRGALQSALNENIKRAFQAIVPQETNIPKLDISEFVMDNHQVLIEMVQKAALSEFNIKVAKAQYADFNRCLYIHFQYANYHSNGCNYDSQEVKSLEEFRKAVTIDVGIIFQRHHSQDSKQKGPFEISWGTSSLREIRFTARKLITQSIKFEHHFYVKPDEIIDIENGKLKMKTVYELANAVLRTEGKPEYCENLEGIQDVQLPVFELPKGKLI